MVCYVIFFGPIQSPILAMRLKLDTVLRLVRTFSTMQRAGARSSIRELPPFSFALSIGNRRKRIMVP